MSGMIRKEVTLNLGSDVTCQVTVDCYPSTPEHSLVDLAKTKLRSAVKVHGGSSISTIGGSLSIISEFTNQMEGKSSTKDYYKNLLAEAQAKLEQEEREALQ